MTPDKIRTARELYDRRQMTVAAIAETLGVSRATIYAHLNGDAGGSSATGPATRKRSPRPRHAEPDAG